MSSRCDVLCEPRDRVALLDAGADVETTDIMGNDPFMAACMWLVWDVSIMSKCGFKKFKTGISIVAKQSIWIHSTQLQCIYGWKGKLELVKYLIEEAKMQRYVTSATQNFQVQIKWMNNSSF